MNIGDTTRTVISKSVKKKFISGVNKCVQTVEVVYKTFIGRSKGRALYASRTRHEPVT